MTKDTRASIASALVLTIAGATTVFILTDRLRQHTTQTPLVGRIVNDLPDGSTAALLLISSPDCKYCQASIPFYARLGAIGSATGGQLALRVVMPVPHQEAAAYLDEHRLLWTVSRVDFRDMGISSTPTLLLVDATRTVRKAWVGLLDKSQQADVLTAIGQVCRECLPSSVTSPE